MQFSYGGDPEAWFDVRPAVLLAYERHREKLEAERVLALYQATAAATGHMKKEARNQWVNSLQKVIRAGQPKRPTTERDIQALGIRVEHG